MVPTSYSAVTLFYDKRLSSEKHSDLLGKFVSFKENEPVNMDPGSLFTTLHILLNLYMSPTLYYDKKAFQKKHSSLLGTFASFEENEEL
jgi:hypothetical protein